MKKFRFERDSIGNVAVPSDAYYGSFTSRALTNFQISGHKGKTELIHALATIKIASAQANMKLKMLDKKRGNAIVKAGTEILMGKLSNQFPLDIFQAGAGTPFNMNVNEVIANRANELLKKKKGSYSIVHPNDHVNMGQSSNDVFPTAIRIASLWKIEKLLNSLGQLEKSLRQKAATFKKVSKSARTHLQDAVPITLGQEFSGYSEAVGKSRQRISESLKDFRLLGIGGTAAGTGLNSHPKFKGLVVKNLSKLTKLKLQTSNNLFEKMQSASDFLAFSNSLAETAVELNRIANDFRLLASGPRTGFNELILPEVEPGSSIMPGKVNPSMAEMLNMVCYQVMGNNHAVELCSAAGQLELNVMTPCIAHNLFESIEILANGCAAFDELCVKGLEANKMACGYYFNYSFGLATVVAPLVGYSKAAALVKEAVKSGRRVKDLIVENGILSQKELDKILKVENATRPNLNLIKRFK